MQDRYAGDVGDFGKFALLRSLCLGMPSISLGVAWYLASGAGESANDGKHTSYLDQPAKFRNLEPVVFDSLKGLRKQVLLDPKVRTVLSLQKLALLPANTVYFGDPCPRIASERVEWSKRMVKATSGAGLVFADPDNGLAKTGARDKHAALNEVAILAKRGPVLVYHHQTRRAGGRDAEFAFWKDALLASGVKDVRAVRLGLGTSRFYFLLNGDAEMRERLAQFGSRWRAFGECYP